MAQAAETGDREFPGDEFANNLFSDLAPLLTLFGEQVTKQFLSMSMGWADNVLLAMGPLGILTIVVSAIRVGGVRQLKALVGRARESLSTAEQELLSSTSDDVCELWSGKEIVRTIGSPAGMKNLIITKEGCDRIGIFSLREALEQNLVHTANLDPDHSGSKEAIDDLSNAAPNLALNVKNATAPTKELWLWAFLGIVLQLTAMAIPGLATYYWNWEKGGSPVASYGYPCFLIGTSLVVIGVMFCGHVIEGVTEERNFQPNLDTGNPRAVIWIVRLQSSCTVGDQHFKPFAIYNSWNDLELRTSRLSGRSYSSLAATATALTVVGFIVQFIGLRALHWSATILQLGVTILMTCVRAYVRRGLATNPVCYTLAEGHEAALLALQLLGGNVGGKTAGPFEYVPHLWEIPTICDYSHRLHDLARRMVENQLDSLFNDLFPVEEFTIALGLEGLLASTATDRPSSATGKPPNATQKTPISEAVEFYEIVYTFAPQNRRTIDVAEMLAKAIERLAATFANVINIQWVKDISPFRDATYQWGVPAIERIYPKDKKFTITQLVVEQGPIPDTSGPGLQPWVLQCRGHLHNLLALWLCTLERRHDVVRLGNDSPAVEEQYWLRVVGRGDPGDSTLQYWLGRKVYQSRKVTHSEIKLRGTITDGNNASRRPPSQNTVPVFGAFLSYSALPIGSKYEGHDLFIRTPRGSDLALQCAQEILSLFMLQVVSKVETLGGGGTETPEQERGPALDREQERAPRLWESPVCRELGDVVVESGLVRDIDEAYTLIIPAFHHYNLLSG